MIRTSESISRLNRREFAAAAAALSLSGMLPTEVRSAPAATTFPLRLRCGVSLAGAEFGSERAGFSNVNPGIYGKDYQYPQQQTIEYFAAQGLGLLRIPFRWERLQPRLRMPLEPAELARIRQVLNYAGGCGAVVVLDLHNYGRYSLAANGRTRVTVIDENVGGVVPVPRTALADLWRRLAAEFVGNPTVVGLGLMNEPHDMGHSDWKLISQAAVDAIREVNREAWVIVPGDQWSNAHRFDVANGPRAWVRDPALQVVYEAHCYFDANASGKYLRTFAEELRDDPQLVTRGAQRIRVFLDWCRRNKVPGFVGEFGIPGDNAGWRDVLSGALREMSAAEAGGCYWAAGEWWNDYPLSIQPQNDFRTPAPQQYLLADFVAGRFAK